jgi:quinol monooxygenase YgiN
MPQADQKLPEDELRAQAPVLRMLDGLEPKLPIAATADFKVDRAKEGAFQSNADALAAATGKMSGLKFFCYHRLKPVESTPGQAAVVEYLIYQEWETVESFRAQFVSEHLQHFLHAVFDLIVAPPELRFYYDAEEKTDMSQADPNKAIDEIRANVNRMLDRLDPRSPIAATVVFHVKRSKESKFVRNADALTEATRRLPGVNVFAYQKHQPYKGEPAEPADSVEYLIYEDWETVRQFRRQWDSEHLKKFQYSVLELLAGPPDLTFYRGWREEGGTTSVRLLKTGQKRCWDSSGTPTDCEDTGQDANFQAGAPLPYPRFTDNGDGTVTDNLTGLVWLKNANLFDEVTRDQALEYARNLASGSYGLSDDSQPGDWRLPNVNELESLLDLNNSSGPALPHGHPFTNLQPANYWSSTSVAAFPALGWYVALAVGPPVFDLKFNYMRMWPVRGESEIVPRTGQGQCYSPFGEPIDCEGTGQDGEVRAGAPWPDPRFTDNGDGTVTDNLTGLVWLKDGNAFGTRTWHQALEDCRSLHNGKCGLTDGSQPGDWRLPNINELRSLEDYGQHTPALPSDHPFTNVRQSLCWSSTTVASAPNLARFLFVGIGSCVWDHKHVLMGVWPVKGGLHAE